MHLQLTNICLPHYDDNPQKSPVMLRVATGILQTISGRVDRTILHHALPSGHTRKTGHDFVGGVGRRMDRITTASEEGIQ
jgi:hypothetical protein